MNEPTEPAEIHNGLAVYQRGQGYPLLALPYPYASGGGPMIDGPLVTLAAGCGFRVSTFDPPGQYRSTRPAQISLEEMLDCATETLATLTLPARVAVLGHSMSALCAFYLALAHPERVAKLVLVGTPPGSGMAIVATGRCPSAGRPGTRTCGAWPAGGSCWRPGTGALRHTRSWTCSATGHASSAATASACRPLPGGSGGADDPGSLVLKRKMLRGIKARAERLAVERSATLPA